MENEFPAAYCGIDVFRQALKANGSAVQIGDPLNQVFEGSTKPVKPPNDEGIPVSDVLQGFR
jgi:hypothetical protein